MREIRNSELVVSKQSRGFLTFHARGLADCVLHEQDDGVVLEFDTTGLDSAQVIVDRSVEDKLRFLVNSAGLESLDEEYQFSMAFDNVMVDLNLMPHVLVRDAKGEGGLPFLTRYKALVGSVLEPRFGQLDYLQGGEVLYQKHFLLADIASMDTVQAVRERLLSEYAELADQSAQNMRLVSKRRVLASRIAIAVLGVLLAAAVAVVSWSVFWTVPYQDAVIKANTTYVTGDFIAAQEALQDYPLSSLSADSRYLLARAYVSTEALTDDQKDNILIGLTPKTDLMVFDYWIHVGRMEFDEAIDTAQRLNDEELLLFAYMKYEAVVRADTAMPGEEKTTVLNELSAQIDQLQQARQAVVDEESTGR
ncbi:MAG: hypothetical protein LBV30_04980 [Propionibacteriaceae bacterium]|jgi:type VII secretion protein EssB|nr:hypothetical protein [Propionibacteriaceae bacterium]